MGWVGFDLDKTLAVYGTWNGTVSPIGEPLADMIALIKQYQAAGTEVRILTARAYPYKGEDPAPMIAAVQDWCEAQGLGRLPVTCEKDPECFRIYDDIAEGVMPNTGRLVREVLQEEIDWWRGVAAYLASCQAAAGEQEAHREHSSSTRRARLAHLCHTAAGALSGEEVHVDMMGIDVDSARQRCLEAAEALGGVEAAT